MMSINVFFILHSLLLLGSLICCGFVAGRMFQHGATGLGVVCIVLLFLGGIGVLVAFVAGWLRADRWGITNLMLTWTALWAASFLLALLYVYTMPGMPSG